MTLNNKLNTLLAHYKKPEDLIDENWLLKQLTKRLLECALETEMSEHLGHIKHGSVSNRMRNARNGKSQKTIKGDFGSLVIAIPRDRNASFKPKIISKHQTSWTGFDDHILSLYARGLTEQEIQACLQDIYGSRASPALTASVTDVVIADIKAWQSRPLDIFYPVVYLEEVYKKMRAIGTVQTKAAYIVWGISLSGEQEVLDLWIAETERENLWLQVVTDMRNRGVKAIFIAYVDGLKGFAEAIEVVFPKGLVRTFLDTALLKNPLFYEASEVEMEIPSHKTARLHFYLGTSRDCNVELRNVQKAAPPL